MKATRHQKMEETRAQVLSAAVRLFLAQGYRATTLDQIAEQTGRSKAALLRAYPDKESLLYALVTFVFGSQFSSVRKLLGPDADPLMIYAVDTAMQLTLCEQSEAIRDIYLSAYSLPSTAEYINKSVVQELQLAFSAYLPHATQSDFYELELASGGMIRGYISRKCDMYFPIERKVRLYLQCAFKIFDVPAEKREDVIAQVMAMDIGQYARQFVLEYSAIVEKGLDSFFLYAPDRARTNTDYMEVR